MSGDAKKYDLIISLGEDCAATSSLRRNKLQLASFPFDWLTKASFSQRVDLLVSEFQNFLNIEDLKLLPKPENVRSDTKCDYYENVKTGFYHYHDFPTGVDIQKSFPVVKEKYERRIQRLYSNIAKSNKILFIWLSRDKVLSDDLIIGYSSKLKQKFADRNVEVLILENNPRKTREDFVINDYARKISYNAFDNISDTMGNKNNTDDILNEYALSLKGYIVQKGYMPKKLKKILNKYQIFSF